MDTSGELDSEQLSNILKDPLFCDIRAVGVNGGEPTLLRDIDQYVSAIIGSLPSLKYLSITSHGFNTSRALRAFSRIKNLCLLNDVKFHISISLDGVGEVHNRVRRIPGGFEKTFSTISLLQKNLNSYCDSWDIACTITNTNVNRLGQLDRLAEERHLPIKYRYGVPNKRIESDKLMHEYSVCSDKRSLFSAREFMHYQWIKNSSITEKFKYYSFFSWASYVPMRRRLGCAWRASGATLDSRGVLYYCAVESPAIGVIDQNNNGNRIFFGEQNILTRSSIVKHSCGKCIHDYGGMHGISDLLSFLMEAVKSRLSMNIYKYMARFTF